MAEANRRRNQAPPPEIDKDAFWAAVQQVLAAASDVHGADRALRAQLGAALLRDLGVKAEAVAGSAAWRVGPGVGDVISHASEVARAAFVPSAPGIPALLFHAWIETASQGRTPASVVDLSTFRLRSEAAELDQANGGRTSFEWWAPYLWVPIRSCLGIGEVAASSDVGVYAYLRHPEIEGRVFGEMRPELVTAAALAYRAHALDNLQPQFYHGTRADLKPGDLIEPGHPSNFGERNEAAYIYLTSSLDTAAWGAELAVGEGPGRIYTVEPTGPVMGDPNLVRDGANPTKSYRSTKPLRVTGEYTGWTGHSSESINAMKDRIERLSLKPIDD